VKQVWLRLVRGLDNPIVRQEGMSRMRTWRAPLAITIYLGLLGGFGYAVFAVGVISEQISHSTQSTTALGAATFDSMTVFELVLVLLFAPALAAGAISGEKERQTFDSLLVSRVSAFGIVWGKLVASLAYILLLVASAIPLFAFVFIFGSIEPDQILITQALIVVTAFTVGSVALFWSALFKRTLAATVSAYGSAFALYGLTAALGWLFTYINSIRYQNAGISTPPDFGLHPLIFGNPFTAFFTLLVPQGSGVVVGSIHLGRLLQLLVMDTGPVSQWGPAITSWQLSLYTQGTLALLCVFGAVMLVRGRRALPLRRVAVKVS
jgi:ABC-2 type transport system permease protein